MMEQGLRHADESGVRMAYLLKAKAAMGAGKVDLAKATIKALAEAQATKEPPEGWRLLDITAREQAQAISTDCGQRPPDTAPLIRASAVG